MKVKQLIYSATIVSILLLAACADTTEETVGNPVEEGGTEETSAVVEGEPAEDVPNGINEVVSDDENVKATIIKMTKVTDDSGRNAYEILFEVENRRTDQIDVGYTDISGDGRPLSSGQSGMSATLIDPGATGHATLSIYEDEEHGLPENLTMALSISKVNPDTPNVLESVKDYPLNVKLPVNGINQVVTDDENVKAAIIEMTKVTDDSGKSAYEILFEIENRRTDQIDVGYTDISGDGRSLSDGQSGMSATLIDPGATGHATLSIYEDEEHGLPENLTMALSISKVNPDTPNVLESVKDYPLDVTF